MRVALHDLRAHLPQVVDKVQSRLEHLLKEKASAARLRRKHYQNRHEVRRKRRPGAVRHGRNRVAEIVFHLEALLRNVAKRPLLRVYRPRHAETRKRPFENLERSRVDAGERELATSHRRGDDVAPRLDVVAPYRRLATVQRLHSLDLDPVRAGARDLRAHRIEHRREVDDMRLTRRVEDDRAPACEDGRHEDVLGRSDRRLVEKNLRALELALEAKRLPASDRLRAKRAEAGKMGVEASVANLVAPGRRQRRASDAGEERPREKEARPDLRGKRSVDFRRLDLGSAKRHRARLRVARHLRAKGLRRVEHCRDVGYVGNVADRHRLGS